MGKQNRNGGENKPAEIDLQVAIELFRVNRREVSYLQIHHKDKVMELEAWDVLLEKEGIDYTKPDIKK